MIRRALRRTVSVHTIARFRDVAVLALGISFVATALTDPTPWHAMSASIWTVLVVLWSVSSLLSVRQRYVSRSPVARRVGPESVPFDDVVAALHSEATRVDRVRHLRVEHPGLALSDAARLVDEVAGRPDR